jgi:mitochondrial protein import protein ZIM17
MLPSRLFRNTGLPPALRSLVTPKPTLPASIQVQLRFRLGINPATLRHNSSSSSPSGHAFNPAYSGTPLPPPRSESTVSGSTTTSQTLPERIEPRLAMTFTCTVEGCGERSTHEFTKRAYTKGIVLVECPGCKNRYANVLFVLWSSDINLYVRHLIADHLGWFKESTEDGKLRTVEDLLKAKGEKIKKGKVNMSGDVEYFEEWAVARKWANSFNIFYHIVSIFLIFTNP